MFFSEVNLNSTFNLRLSPALRSDSGSLLSFLRLVEQGGAVCVEIDLGLDMRAWWEAATQRVSVGEAEFARRFHHPEDGIRHMVGRALIRQLLGRLLNIRRLSEEFSTSALGKPGLPASGLEFSISHSGRFVWGAVSRACAVGIDIEREDPAVEYYDIAGMFHPAECAAIRALPAQAAQDAFFRLWTRKESVVKATGKGLSMPLTAFRVLTECVERDWLVKPPASAAKGWTCADLPGAAGYHVSVAAMSPDLSIGIHRLAVSDFWHEAPVS